jgi:hypothetical protein
MHRNRHIVSYATVSAKSKMKKETSKKDKLVMLSYLNTKVSEFKKVNIFNF